MYINIFFLCSDKVDLLKDGFNPRFRKLKLEENPEHSDEDERSGRPQDTPVRIRRSHMGYLKHLENITKN